MFETEKEDVAKISDVSLFTLLDIDLHKHNITSAAQYCCKY